MVTGFSLTLGYIYSGDQEITMEQLHEITRKVGRGQKIFFDKCVEYGLEEDLICGCKLSKLLEKYKDLSTDDGTCNLLEWGVLQSCYGSSGHRNIREQICRAFGVLVLDECYKKGYSVSFEIT